MPAGPIPAAVFPIKDNIRIWRLKNMRFCGHLKDGTQLLLTDDEIINNALEQEKQGIKPHYCFYDYKCRNARRFLLYLILRAYKLRPFWLAVVWLVQFQPQALSIYFYMLFFVYLEKLI